MGKDGVEHANADRTVNDKVCESTDRGEDERVNERSNNIEIKGADMCGTKGGNVTIPTQTHGKG